MGRARSHWRAAHNPAIVQPCGKKNCGLPLSATVASALPSTCMAVTKELVARHPRQPRIPLPRRLWARRRRGGLPPPFRRHRPYPRSATAPAARHHIGRQRRGHQWRFSGPSHHHRTKPRTLDSDVARTRRHRCLARSRCKAVERACKVLGATARLVRAETPRQMSSAAPSRPKRARKCAARSHA